VGNPLGRLTVSRWDATRGATFLEDGHDEGVELRTFGRGHGPELQAE